MLENLNNQRIEKLKEKIKVDMSKLISKKLILPFEFQNTQKVGTGIYKVTTPVFKLNGQFYPQDLFWSYGIYDDSIVAFIHADYQAVGEMYRTVNDNWFPGIKAEKNKGNMLENYLELLEFELDLKKNKYKRLTGNAEEKPANQTETQMGQ